ncbi:MAG: DUF927 domain-containing protein [Magnetococcales bacterium]|nr:DUF927 domain-containing protein [Magnetococcales bacterium]
MVDQPYTLDDSGLWFQGDGERIWLSSPLKVVGRTRNPYGVEHGLLLRWKDPDDQDQQLVVPAELLADDGKELRRQLLFRGLKLATSLKARRLFLAWIAHQRPEHAILTTRDVGWIGGAYVLPDVTIGQGEPIILEGHENEIEEQVSGGIDEWGEFVGYPCGSHDNLIVAICAAFAGAIIHWTQDDSFGLHFFGGSSIGKTTLLYVAQSVWGPPTGMHRWRTTANALENIAGSRNDRLLCLDEIAQLDPRHASEVAYMLGNGKGKHRATKEGGAIQERKWRLIYLSTGEISLSEYVESNGGRMKGGMEVRHLDVPADTGENGVLNKLFSGETAKGVVDALRNNTQTCFGAVGREWVSHIQKDPMGAVDRIERDRKTFVTANLNPKLEPIKNGQLLRVCERFALLAGVGEEITRIGFTGWKEDFAMLACLRVFHKWMEARGGNHSFEHVQAVKKVREFIVRHGDSRFEAQRGQEAVVRDRAGVWKTRPDDQGREYLFFPDVFVREVCEGIDPQEVLKALADRGYLRRGDGKNLAVKERVPGAHHPCRMYAVQNTILTGRGD